MDSNNEPTNDDLLSVMELLGENRLSDALNLVDGMIEKFPMSAKLLNIQGVINHKLNQFEAAINCYWQALKIKSDYAGAYNNMGNTFKAKGDFEWHLASHCPGETLGYGKTCQIVNYTCRRHFTACKYRREWAR